MLQIKYIVYYSWMVHLKLLLQVVCFQLYLITFKMRLFLKYTSIVEVS